MEPFPFAGRASFFTWSEGEISAFRASSFAEKGEFFTFLTQKTFIFSYASADKTIVHTFNILSLKRTQYRKFISSILKFVKLEVKNP